MIDMDCIICIMTDGDNVCMQVGLCVCVWIYVLVCVFVCVRACVRGACVRACVCMCVCVFIYLFINSCFLGVAVLCWLQL